MDFPKWNAALLIDFHTHRAKHQDREDIFEVLSVDRPLDQQWFTLERHPWNISSEWSAAEKQEIITHIRHPKCLALGEIGLDKQRGIALEEQISVLRSLLAIANQERVSVVIHCVKSFGEIIQLKKEFPQIPNWAIHGFNKKPELAKQLIQQGFYLSLNVARLRQPEALLAEIPRNRLFLETDDSSDLIEENYIRTGKIMKVAIEDLKWQIAQNAKEFYR